MWTENLDGQRSLMTKGNGKTTVKIGANCLALGFCISTCFATAVGSDPSKTPHTNVGSLKASQKSKPPASSTSVQSVEKQSESAAQALKTDSRDVAALAVLRKNLNNPVAYDRAATVIAIRKAGRSARALVPELISALKDESTTVRGEAATTLGAIGPDAKAAIESLKQASTSTHPPEQGAGCCMVQRDLWVHAAAEKALKKISGK